MKNRVIVSTIYILIGILICLIPTYLYPVCNGEMKMACYYTKQAEIGLGILITLLGIVFIAAKNENIRIGISISQLLVALLVFLYPIKLIGLCKMSTMACQMRTLPALTVAGVFLVVISAGNRLYLIRKDK